MNMNINTDISKINFKINPINKNFESIILNDNDNKELFIKTPRLFYRYKENNDYYFEFSLESDDFYKNCCVLEDRIKDYILENLEIKFNEKSLDELHNSFLKLPKSIKMSPLIKIDGSEFHVYDKNNNIIKKDIEEGVAVISILQLNKIKFKKTYWEIILSLIVLKPLEETEQLSDYMFKDSEEDTNIVLDTECL